MVTQKNVRPLAVGQPRHRHDKQTSKRESTAGRRLAILRDDIVSLKREGVVAFTRWYRYRKAVHELSTYEDRALHELGIDRSEIEISVYCIAERAVSARPE